jgi:hypothetical protein
MTIFENTPLVPPNMRGLGGSLILFWIGILIFLLVRSPCIISKPDDNPFWDFRNGGKKRKRKINY